MRKLFKIGNEDHGRGEVLFQWQPEGNLLATAGQNGLVHIFDRHGQRVDELSLGGSGRVLALRWDADGESLAILQEGNGIISVWEQGSRSVTPVDTCLKEPTFLAWSRVGPQLAVGTSKGNLLIYNKQTRKKIPVIGKHPRRITCGAWSRANLLALGSEDCTLTVSREDGATVEQVEIKHAPTDMCFAAQKQGGIRTVARPGEEKESAAAGSSGGGGGGGGLLGGGAAETTVSVNMSGKSLLLYCTEDPDNPVELAFQQKYGAIICHRWFGDGYLLVGFGEGYVAVVSTHMSEIGEEQFSARLQPRGLVDVAYSPMLKRAAVAGPEGVKVVDMNSYAEVKDEAVALGADNAAICGVAWSPDGQILTVAARSGALYNFLARMPAVHAGRGSRVAYMSSLREITVVETAGNGPGNGSGNGPMTTGGGGSSATPVRPLVIRVDIEPRLLALGPRHVAVGMNNRVLYYRAAATGDCGRVAAMDYSGAVQELALNDSYAAVLANSQVVLHSLEGGDDTGGGGGGGGGGGNSAAAQRRTFPEREDGAMGAATALGLTDSLLIYGTRGGTVEFFHIPEWAPLAGAELRHTTAVRRLWPNYLGTRVLLADATNAGYVYSPATDELVAVPGFSPGARVALWDEVDRNVFMVADGRQLHFYVYAAASVKGGAVHKLGPAEVAEDGSVAIRPESGMIPADQTPVVSCGGQVTTQLESGQLGSFVAAPYEHVVNGSGGARAAPEQQRRCFLANLALLRLKQAWRGALHLDDRRCWLALSHRSMEVLDVQMAINVYRQLGDAGMVAGLERIAGVEDKNLLAANISLLFGDYQAAQELFLTSTRPVGALEMRRDLFHWDQALKLGQTLAPEQVPEISARYGQQLEFRGDTEQALRMYEEALAATTASGLATAAAAASGTRNGSFLFSEGKQGEAKDPGSASELLETGATESAAASSREALRQTCVAGIARCVLRRGDLRRGVRLAREAGSPTLCQECAAILEEMRQPAEAAALYEAGGQFDKAAAIHIAARNLPAAAAVMPRVTLSKLLGQYARACEAAEEWSAAADAYERARDMDAVARLCLEHLDEPERALAVVRATASAAGAEMLSRHCQDRGDWRGAVEFLLMARKTDEALALAKARSLVDAFAEFLGDAIGPEEALAVARHYEAQRDPGRAGKFYALCGQQHRALRLFLQCGEAEVGAAIALVGKARMDLLTHTLIDFLMGETDGVPKEPTHIYRLYMALGNLAQAGKTAAIIARQEQDLGNYRQAHAILHETIRELEAQGARVPQALRRDFVLLHSYVLAKQLARRGDHEGAARMLLRVASEVSRFPSHTVAILTSAVIECQRAGLRNSAFDFASVLMRPEHRSSIDKKYRRSVESIVRRPSREELQEGTSPCPISGEPICHTVLECPTTKDPLPMCVVTGRHMLRGDWCVCPRSRMPAILSEYLRYLRSHAAATGAASGGNRPAADDVDPAADGGGDDVGGSGGGRRRSSGAEGISAAAAAGTAVAGPYEGPDPVLGQVVSSAELALSTDAEIDDYLRQFAGGGEHEGEGENNPSAAPDNGSAATAAAAVAGAGPPLPTVANTIRTNQLGG